MNKSILDRLTIFGCCIAVLTFVFATQAIAQSSKSGNVKTEIVPVYQFGTSTIIPQAGGSLSSNNEGVLGTISTSRLTPGHVITVWWSIFNNPEIAPRPFAPDRILTIQPSTVRCNMEVEQSPTQAEG